MQTLVAATCHRHVAIYIIQICLLSKNKAHPFGWTLFLELLARFELATSSLPTISEQILPCVACRKLLDKTLVYQGLFSFACCSLLHLAVGVLCRFFMARVGFYKRFRRHRRSFLKALCRLGPLIRLFYLSSFSNASSWDKFFLPKDTVSLFMTIHGTLITLYCFLIFSKWRIS